MSQPQPPTCPTHPHVRLLCPACTGGKGGQVTGGAKAKASAQNAAKARATRAQRREEN